MTDHSVYSNPLIERYASKDMRAVFSSDHKFTTWRRLWIALAESEQELGVAISDAQIAQLKENISPIDYDKAAEYEKKFRHDVMAHIHTYGDAAPLAKSIIHAGATSAFVGDNADIIIMYEALAIIKKKLVNTIGALAGFALRYKDLPTLGFTHFQPAQLTTVGKRAALWLSDFMLDMEEIAFVEDSARLRGVKGTTGTQASFMELFDNDEEKVRQLNVRVIEKMGFKRDFPVTGQTYPRKFDSRMLNVLSSIAQSAHKFACDMRLLQGLKELEEPFESTQVGSSAMAYKRNPMRSERICSLARYVESLAQNTAVTASTQWLERTLDDSANRRITIPEAFLAADAILGIAYNIIGGIEVNEKVIEKNIQRELPFMATENILMHAVGRGGDRQELHEKIRRYSMQAGYEIKKEGKDNRLLEMIAGDETFMLSMKDIAAILDPKLYTGRSAQITERYISAYVKPVLEENAQLLGLDYELKV
jgi:adenylosuccinate lyase